ncbi:MAG TPA: hypothetical protein VFE61_22915 [Candidatus Sulfotelmatobacter sp.]|nr:hypothetical protein [Candidatus Sulfotelmatobacter sp.]
MGDRYWLWVGARLLVGLALVAWVGSYVGAGSGEKEFQKTLDAMKQVRSVRVASTANQPGVQHNEMLWEVDCKRDIAHRQMHMVNISTNPPSDMKQDQMFVAGHGFERKSDGSWAASNYIYGGWSARGYCTNLAQGIDSNLLPQIATMIKRGIIQKGDKKTVNGVRCREWLVTMRGGVSALEHDTVCLGLDDHLPYEMTTDWAQFHETFSDYNTPIKFDAPEALLQPASAATGSN